ncbi:MAG: cell division protein FtsL [Burkholderiales bacterium]|nr:cell division protein FtsL [Burkholderiales bacterium]
MSGRAFSRAATIAMLALLLVLACLSLVTSQHRSRGLFVELGRLQLQSKDLEAEGNRLRIELGKAAQPAAVAGAARSLGLRPTESKQTVFLPRPAPGELAAAAGPKR